MLNNWSLQNRLISAFIFMGSVVFAVGVVGWRGSSQLSNHINVLSKNTLPSISGLWKINEGQTQIQSAERALVNPYLTAESRQVELKRIEEAWQQINQGFEEYNSDTRETEEEIIYQEKFLPNWENWKSDHQAFMATYKKLETINIFNPNQKINEVLKQGSKNSSELETLQVAADLQAQLNRLLASEALHSFNSAADDMLALIDFNYDLALVASEQSDRDVKQTSVWVLTGIILGPIVAIIFGIYFSISIAKPLGAKLSKIVNDVVSSASEIAATTEQHERTANQQAASVNQTSITMEELAASSRQAADRAAAATTGAKAIAQQLCRLSEQTKQISSINNLVSDLASQTNILALNASVEAARAGEHGKGFAVVASAIRQLADQSKKSADKINTLVDDIQALTEATVLEMGDGIKVESIISAVNNIVTSSQQISINAQQQAIAIQQVVTAMNTINEGAVQTACGITQTKIGVHKLNEVASVLKSVV